MAGYYDHISHHTLYGQLVKLLPNKKFILRLLFVTTDGRSLPQTFEYGTGGDRRLLCPFYERLGAGFAHPLAVKWSKKSGHKIKSGENITDIMGLDTGRRRHGVILKYVVKDLTRFHLDLLTIHL